MRDLKDGNWGLKLLALILAIVIYHAVKNDLGTNHKFNDRHILQPN